MPVTIIKPGKVPPLLYGVCVECGCEVSVPRGEASSGMAPGPQPSHHTGGPVPRYIGCPQGGCGNSYLWVRAPHQSNVAIPPALVNVLHGAAPPMPTDIPVPDPPHTDKAPPLPPVEAITTRFPPEAGATGSPEERP
jgi:hypothetical protein